MTTTDKNSGTKKLILLGTAIAIPLAAVALYFAFFDQPPPAPPAPRLAQPPAPPGAPGAEGVPAGQAALPPDHPPVGGPPGGPKPPVGGPASSAPAEAGPSAPAGHPQTGAARPIRITEAVKGKWQAVKLRVEQRGEGKAPQVFTVALGGQLDIPGSKLRVRVGDFLPALQVSGNEVTSVSNQPTNPAVMVTVLEGGKEAFRGWLFGKFPDMQPFQHPTYRITLVEGIPKS